VDKDLDCLLGVDGGGSKTAFLLADAHGSRLAHTELGGCFLPETGDVKFVKILTDGMDAVVNMAGVSVSNIKSAVFGAPGYGEFTDMDARIETLIRGLLNAPEIEIYNDADVAHAGSLALKPGVHIVAGTGAIALGVDLYGNRARSNGWHEAFSDEGSAYWLGMKTFALFAKQSDRRLPRGPLYDIIRKYFDIDSDFDIITIFDREYKNRRDKTAGLAVPLREAAQAGDKGAIDLYGDAAYELAISALGVHRALGFGGSCLCSYSGGLFNAGDLLLKPIKHILDGSGLSIRLAPPELNPICGAVLLAAKAYGQTDLPGVAERLKEEIY